MNLSPLIGYYDRPDQPHDQPTYDPPHDGPCIVCFEPLTAETVRTVGVMDIGGKRSYFYRLHRACHDALTEEDRGALESSVLNTERKEQTNG